MIRGTFAVTVVAAITTVAARAQEFTTYSFAEKHGATPTSALVQSFNGDLYGTTQSGGAYNNGAIFRMSPAVTLTTLYSFCSQSGCPDGSTPYIGLVQATDGKLYGTTSLGGANNGGTVFEFTPGGGLKTLYSFCASTGCADGQTPWGVLIQAADSNLYGTTSAGGTYGGGTVFKITPGGILTTLYNFCSQSGCADGADPMAGLVQASDGYFYGTTFLGGNTNSFCAPTCGTVFKMTPNGELTTLYEFCAQNLCPDGRFPFGPLVQASDGNLYGTTQTGANGDGTVFRISPRGSFATIYNFCSVTLCKDGAEPIGGLIQATDGNLYGTTSNGGTNRPALGTIFQITLSGVLTTLYSFCSATDCFDGTNPDAAVLQATDGTLYGTTSGGGVHHLGTAYSLTVGLGPFVTPLTTSGKVGDTVKILGSSLTGATSVTFNGTAATFTVNTSGGAITATVPSGATTGAIEVVTPNGTLSINVPFRLQ